MRKRQKCVTRIMRAAYFWTKPIRGGERLVPSMRFPQFAALFLIFSLTLSFRAVIASVNQIHSRSAFMGVLRDRMIEEMKLRNFSPATQQSYVYAVSRLAKYHHKSPDQLSMCISRWNGSYRRIV